MKNILEAVTARFSLLAAACLSLTTITMTGQALAQANSLPQPQRPQPQTIRVIDAVSINDMVQLFTAVGFSTSIKQNDQEGIQLELRLAQAPTQGAAYVALRDCDRSGFVERCQLVEPFAFIQVPGMTLARANDINLNKTKIANFGLAANEAGIIATKIYLYYGVTPQHLAALLGLFFDDIPRVINAAQNNPNLVNTAQTPTQGITGSANANILNKQADASVITSKGVDFAVPANLLEDALMAHLAHTAR